MTRLIPNILTFGRFVLTIVFLVIILDLPYIGNKHAFLDTAFVLFIIAAITDMIDGALARKFNVASKFGRMMDPLVDKILVCGAFVCFAIIGEPKLFNLPEAVQGIIRWSVAGVTILREVYVTVLRHIAEAKGIDFAATASGKIKMFLQSFAIGVVIIKAAYVPNAEWGHWFMVITFAVMLIVTVISGIRATQRPSWKKVVSSEPERSRVN
jgi:CDP-diacylglycerol--glycerol-3-phosphate 3-phosphatidyltransferase